MPLSLQWWMLSHTDWKSWAGSRNSFATMVELNSVFPDYFSSPSHLWCWKWIFHPVRNWHAITLYSKQVNAPFSSPRAHVYAVYVCASQSVSLSLLPHWFIKARCWEVLVILLEQILNSCAHGMISHHCLLGEQTAPEGVNLSLFFSPQFTGLFLLPLHFH